MVVVEVYDERFTLSCTACGTTRDVEGRPVSGADLGHCSTEGLVYFSWAAEQSA